MLSIKIVLLLLVQHSKVFSLLLILFLLLLTYNLGIFRSSIPIKNTTGNSSPFALCKVINVTASSVSSSSSTSLVSVILSKNSAKLFSAASSSNSIATVKNSSKFSSLVSACVVLSSSKAFVYPVLFSVCFTSSEILISSLLALNSSITFTKSLEFANTLFSPNSSAFLLLHTLIFRFVDAIDSIFLNLFFLFLF